MSAVNTAPASDIPGYRRALGSFATGVAVVTIAGARQPRGMTINSFAPVSLVPPLVLWSIGERHASCPDFCAASRFAIHVLSRNQRCLADRFASSAGDPFEGIDWQPDAHGIPSLRGCITRFSCVLRAIHPGGDHRILVGEVEEFACVGGSGLLFVDGRYAESAGALGG